jgi:PAP2 superfamily protein
VNSLSEFLFITALCSSVFIPPLAAQTAPKDKPSSGTSSSTSVSPSVDSSNSTEDPSAPSKGPTYGPNSCDVSQLRICVKDFLGDQAGIWTSPLRLHAQDALWLLPLAGATAVSLHYDVQTLQQVSTSPNSIRMSNDLSNVGAYGAIGAAGATYIIGKVTHNETARETGVLSLEAIADSGLVTEVLKLATNRQRPYMGTGQGHFWPDGSNIYTTNGSFPSEHATIVWAFSHVVVDETPGHRWLHLGLYAVAAGVSAARVTSRNHFPSDVIVGSAIGYLVGGYVYRQHSNSYDSNIVKNGFTISPVYDAANRSYGMGVTIDPNALRSVRLKQLRSKTSITSEH